jgi:hypothetical protein
MGKGGGGTTETKSTVTQTNLPEYVRPYFERLLGRTEAESKRAYEPYGGQRIADPSQDLLTSEQRVRDIANMGLPGIAKSEAAIDTGLGAIQRGFGVFDTGQRLVGEGSEVARGTLDQLGKASDRTEQAFGFDIEATGRQQAFDRASQLFEADRRAEMGLDQTRADERRRAEQIGLGAAQQFGSLGQSALGVGQALGGFGSQMGQFGQGIAGLGTQFGQLGGQYANLSERARAGDVDAARMLEQIGKAQMARDQASLDMGYQDFLRQQSFPQERLGLFSSVLRGIPVTPSQTTSTRMPYDPFGRAIGLGLTALGGAKYFG